jgi:putative membrane protein
MKKPNCLTGSLLQSSFIIVIIIFIISCGEYQNHQESKDVSEKHNDEIKKNNDFERESPFLVNAALMHMELISLGQLAQKNGSLPDVKESGKIMEAEHKKLFTDLKKLADEKLFVLPSSPTDQSHDIYNSLIEEPPANFDKAYCKTMIKDHEDAIKLFEKASTESTDQEIKDWAIRSLPVLKKQLDHAINCQKKSEKM